MRRPKEKLVCGPKRTFTDCLYVVVYNFALTSAACSFFLKGNPNLILAFDLRIFYFVSKDDCNIRLIVFQTTVKLCSKNK